MANDTNSSDPTAGDATGVWRGWAWAGGGAAVMNLIIFALGLVGGLDYSVTTQPDAPAMEVTAGLVLVSSVVPLMLGLAVAQLARLRWPSSLRVLQILGGVVAVASVAMPLAAAGDVATGVALAAMHLVVGAAWVVALARMRRA